jgi:outer membrane immunogenic protein
MNKLILVVAAAALTFTCDAAIAADLGHSAGGFKDEPTPVAGVSWTGFYLGVGLGGGMANVDDRRTATIAALLFADTTEGRGAQGIFGTVQAGADYRFQGTRFLAGVFGDYDFGTLSESDKSRFLLISREDKVQLDDRWTIGGRLGVLATPDTLVYGLAGYSGAKQSVELSGPFNVFPDGTTSKSVTTGGLTLGAGIETRLSGNWFLKGEYRYTSYETGTLFNLGNPAIFNRTRTLDTDTQTVRAVLTYKLGAERPESFK